MNFTITDISKILDVPLKTVYRLIDKEHIPILKVMDQVYFEPFDFLDWCISKNISIKYNILQNYFFDSKTNFNLSEAISSGKLFYIKNKETSNKIIESIINELLNEKNISGKKSVFKNLDKSKIEIKTNKELLLNILLNKHEVKPLFVIKNEVAIPFLRTPIITDLEKPEVIMFFLNDYKNFGAKFVHAWFWILSPTVNAHTQLVEKLYRALLKPAFFELVTGHKNWEDIIIEAGKCELNFKMYNLNESKREEST